MRLVMLRWGNRLSWPRNQVERVQNWESDQKDWDEGVGDDDER